MVVLWPLLALIASPAGAEVSHLPDMYISGSPESSQAVESMANELQDKSQAADGVYYPGLGVPLPPGYNVPTGTNVGPPPNTPPNFPLPIYPPYFGFGGGGPGIPTQLGVDGFGQGFGQGYGNALGPGPGPGPVPGAGPGIYPNAAQLQGGTQGFANGPPLQGGPQAGAGFPQGGAFPPNFPPSQGLQAFQPGPGFGLPPPGYGGPQGPGANSFGGQPFGAQFQPQPPSPYGPFPPQFDEPQPEPEPEPATPETDEAKKSADTVYGSNGGYVYKRTK
ncbi:U1 small nuclear ribonucleoprotein C [Scaptodrosophila lebanonensis]|uniref:U1 small nuclear ribonucleoprotein C n=1 Tax=Drosophila lebanonensis TaxID=7225 RepID=A0A6J2TVG0_DROLE|nr:U1 small nuclear ribonucleoprotein C [Scaptodrosophila lebanonensis]